MNSQLMRIELRQINHDPSGIQPRMELCKDTVKRYAELLDDGVDLPPIRLWDIEETPGQKWRISDGYHRYAAHRAAKKKFRMVPAIVMVGSMTECVLDALQANAIHGKPLTSDERYTAILSYLALLSQNGGKIPSIKNLADTGGVSTRVAKKALNEYKQSPATQTEFADRSPAAEFVAESIHQGETSASELTAAQVEEEVEEIASSTRVKIEAVIHDGKVASANLRNAMTAMEKAYRSVEALPGGVYFKQHRSTFDKYLETLRRLERGCRPAEVCACDGQGCNTCNGYGFINGNQAGA